MNIDLSPLNTHLATIKADGQCVYNWEVIKSHAQLWTPYCSDLSICLAKLLAPFAPKEDSE